MPIDFDLSNFPTVVISYVGDISHHDMINLNASLLKVLSKQTRFMLISDMSAGSPNGETSKIAMAFVDQYRNEFRRYCVGNCLIIPSLPAQAMVRAALLLAKPPFPVRIEGGRIAAGRWSSEQLLKAADAAVSLTSR